MSLIRTLYRLLGLANTARHIASGNPERIARHLVRRQTVKLGGRLIPPTKKGS